jgi:hypothetical protein
MIVRARSSHCNPGTHPQARDHAKSEINEAGKTPAV